MTTAETAAEATTAGASTAEKDSGATERTQPLEKQQHRDLSLEQQERTQPLDQHTETVTGATTATTAARSTTEERAAIVPTAETAAEAAPSDIAAGATTSEWIKNNFELTRLWLFFFSLQ